MSLTMKQFILKGGESRSRALMMSKIQMESRSPKVAQLAGIIWDILVETHYLKDVTYMHLVQGMSYQDILNATDINENTLRTTIYRDKKRFVETMSGDVLNYIGGRNYNEAQTNAYISIADSLQQQQEPRGQTGNLMDKLNIRLDEYVYVRDNQMGDAEYNQAINQLAMLSKPYVAKVVDTLADEELLGYIKYLLGTNAVYMTDRDKERRQRLIQTWWLNL